MKLITEAEVLKRISLHGVLEAVERALISAADGSGAINPVVISSGPRHGEVFSIKSGVVSQAGIVGLKVGTYWPRNIALGMAAHGSTIMLLHPATGHVTLVVEASALNGPRTAAADAAAAKVLARANSATLTLIGAGHQAAHEARALHAVLPIRKILVVCRSATKGERFCDELRRELKIVVEMVSAEQGCSEADVLVTATPSREPLFDCNWLKPGVHVASMGSDQVGKQELPVELLRQARLFCDLPSQSLCIGEFQHVKDDIIAGRIRLTTIGDVLAGRSVGRVTDEEITVFDSSGLALQDLFVAASLRREVQ